MERYLFSWYPTVLWVLSCWVSADFTFKMLRGSGLNDLESGINNGSWKTAALITKSELLLLYLEEKSPVWFLPRSSDAAFVFPSVWKCCSCVPSLIIYFPSLTLHFFSAGRLISCPGTALAVRSLPSPGAHRYTLFYEPKEILLLCWHLVHLSYHENVA